MNRMNKKLLLVVIAVVVIALALGGLLYYRHHKSQKNCVSFYDKTGTKLLYKDCDQDPTR